MFLKHTMLKYLGVNVMTSRANSQVVQEKLLQRDGDKKKRRLKMWQSTNNWKTYFKSIWCSMYYLCNLSIGFEISQNERLMGESYLHKELKVEKRKGNLFFFINSFYNCLIFITVCIVY